MKHQTSAHIVHTFALATLLLFVQGCTTNGYITSSVGTVVGLDVSENPKTQIPHVKFGYVRTGLYYVPTGKTAYGDSRRQNAEDAATNRDSVKDTPTLVSEIFVHSKFLGGITISEKFAIGETAVRSTAAATAFANSSAQAVAAKGTVESGIRVVVPEVAPRQEVVPRSRKAVKNEDIPTADAATRRKLADKARGTVYAALEKVPENKKTPAFFNTVMQGAPSAHERSELGLSNYLDKETDPIRITAVGARIKDAQ